MARVITPALTSYKSASKALASQRLINGYAEFQPRESGAKARVAVYGSHGIANGGTPGTGPIRGSFEMNEVGYVVSGQQFLRFESDGSSTIIGNGITGFGGVSIDGDGFSIVIVNGALGWLYVMATNAFTQISDGDFNPAKTVTVINNYYAFDWVGTNKFFISGLLDGSSYDALDFASGESNPDFVRAVRNRNGVLLVFGAETIESWDHTGATDFPFQRFKSGTIDRGIAASLAIEAEDSTLFFLGDDLVYYALNGNQLRRISTHAYEEEWQQYAKTDDAFCFKISYGGHKFIYITFPTEGKTFGFDIAANSLWHERMSFDQLGQEVKWRASCAVTVYNKTWIGDANSNRLGLLDPNTFTEWGTPIVTTLVYPTIHADGDLISMPKFEIDMQVGVGNAEVDDPQVMLDWSDDGANTWVSPQIWHSMGKIGDYRKRLEWTELGSFYNRAMRISISDPVKRVIYAARCPGLYAEHT